MSFQPSRTETIKTLFHGNRFVIPDYQRRYSWRYEERIALFDDIKENLKMNHFIGTLCFHKIDSDDDIVNDFYEIIDGQQRTTTLYILLNVLIERITDKKIKKDLEGLFIGSKDKLKLQPLGKDKAFIKKLIFKYESIDYDGLVIRSQRFLYEAKRDFISCTESFNEATCQQWINYISQQIELLIFNVQDQSQAVKMFTVINDRGLDLSNIDKTKSTLMLYSTVYLDGKLNQKINERFGAIYNYLDNTLQKKEALQLFRTLDELEFENTFYTHHYYSSRMLFDDWDYQLGANSIFNQLKRKCEESKLDKTTLFDFINNYTEDFYSFGKAYSELFDKISTEDKYVQYFQYLEFTATLYPFIVRLFEQGKLNNLLDILEVTELRIYKLKNTNPRRNMYMLSSEIVENDYTTKEIAQKIIAFNTDFLNDYRLEEYLNDSVDNKTALVRYIMYCYNKQNFNQEINIDKYRNLQVEHIFSVNPNFGIRKYGFGKHEIYDSEISKIGNLTILERKLNSKVSNVAPIDKADGYQQSKIKLISNLLGKLHLFNKDYIQQRNEGIVNFCNERYKIQYEN